MKSFNVLDRKQNIHQNYLLEASAGTGKTFSIENIVVRLLIENRENSTPLKIDQILVVTFTRMATKDLKIRIRSNIEKCLDLLTYYLEQNSFDDMSPPDFLLNIVENGSEYAIASKKALERALHCFDQSQIFTIHGFCSNMLANYVFEGDINLGNSENKILVNTQILKIIRDYLRTELHLPEYSLNQLKILSKEFENNSEKLESALLKLITNGLEIVEQPDFSTLFQKFCPIMASLKNALNLESNRIISDFIVQAPFYKEICDKSGKIKTEILEKVEIFASLFEKSDWCEEDFDTLIDHGITLVEALDPKNLKAKAKPPEASALNYPGLLNDLTELSQLINCAKNPTNILTRVAKGCKQLFKRFLTEEEQFGYDDLLKAMEEKIANPELAEKIIEQFKAVIIDEFQDTDPIQWNIFKSLFLSSHNNILLYLVGDPKQSIYAFRQADIYTYLSAAEALGKDHHASLDTNFRSQSSLVDALNLLFSEELTPQLIPLPKLKNHLKYSPVNAGNLNLNRTITDQYKSLHFCIFQSQNEIEDKYSLDKIENEYLFPFFAKEIVKLSVNEGFELKEIAFLVADRFQAERLSDYLKKSQIPANLQRSKNITESISLCALQDILRAIISPKNESNLKTALGGKLIGWSDEDIKKLNDDFDLYEQVLYQAFELRKVFYSEGFSVFFSQLLKSNWFKTNSTVLERLLSQIDGIEFFNDLNQIAELLFDFQSTQYSSPEALLNYLERLHLLEIDDHESIKKQKDPNINAISILTLHSSKGLEFDIVFTLGLINSTKEPSELLPKEINGKLTLVPLSNLSEQDFIDYCDEIDGEKIRQLYVGMTRAKYRLYTPVVFQKSKKEIKLGTASPMELFVAKFGEKESSTQQLYERIKNCQNENFVNFLNTCEDKISRNFLKREDQQQYNLQIDDTCNLVAPKTHKINEQKILLHSFTSLSKSISKGSEELILTREETKDKTAFTLPSNAEIGLIFHSILEKINFSTIAEFNLDQIKQFILPFLQSSEYEEWLNIIADIIIKTLKSPIKIDGTNFTLAQLQDDQIFKEMEFVYYINENDNFSKIEKTDNTGYLQGVVDLIFYHNDKYYILDWKSNWLGNSSDDYSQEKIKFAMTQHHYDLQALIYTQALEKYLKIVDPRPFNQIFGGAIYVFLRGIDDKGNGIYHFNPYI